MVGMSKNWFDKKTTRSGRILLACAPLVAITQVRNNKQSFWNIHNSYKTSILGEKKHPYRVVNAFIEVVILCGARESISRLQTSRLANTI